MIPQIPTDNLYKFCALSGLLGYAAASFVLPITINEELSEKISESKIRIIEIESDIDWLISRRNTIEQILESYSENQNEQDSATILLYGKIPVQYSNEEIKELVYETKERQFSTEKLASELELKLIDLESLNSKKKTTYWYGKILATLFAYLAFWGFFKWYKLQKQYDLKLKNES